MKKEDLINEVMDEFDYDKVQRVMEFLNWDWASVNGVLSVGDLKRMSRILLISCINGAMAYKKDYSASTGGFKAEATWDNERNKIYSLTLRFVLEETEYYKD
jgi:hypothetical protein